MSINSRAPTLDQLKRHAFGLINTSQLAVSDAAMTSLPVPPQNNDDNGGSHVTWADEGRDEDGKQRRPIVSGLSESGGRQLTNVMAW